MLIISDTQLQKFAERARDCDVLAVDTEFIRERTYRSRLCLIQLATYDEQVAIDPFAVKDVAPMVELFCDESITKVFHSCSQDMEVLLDYCGVLPRPLFDTQIAYSYLNTRTQIGYASLVEEYCKVSLSKSNTLTDWSRRPLDADQVAYALDDVRYLPKIWRMMTERLEELGRSAWPQPDFDRATDPATYTRDPREAYMHVKRISALSRRQMAVAREVAAWREEKADRLDRPRKRIMADEIVVEVSKRCPLNVGDLKKIRGTDELSAADQRSVVSAVRKGLDVPAEQCPVSERHARPSAEVESVVELMYALIRMVAENRGLAPNVIASREDLLSYLDDPLASELSCGWRACVAGDLLASLLKGDVGLTVTDGKVRLL